MLSSKDNRGAKSRLRLRTFQVLVLALLIVLWHVLTSPTLLPPIYFAEANQAAFFFGEPVKVFTRLWQWFVSGEIYEHLWVTLVETLLAFLIGTVSGVVIGRGQVAVTVATPRAPAETTASLGTAQQAAPVALANANPPAVPKAE